MGKSYRYLIVPAPGMYGDGDSVVPARTNKSLAEARRQAKAMTAKYQASMRSYGGSTGYYRVIEGSETWIFGQDLDRIPSV